VHLLQIVEAEKWSRSSQRHCVTWQPQLQSTRRRTRHSRHRKYYSLSYISVELFSAYYYGQFTPT